jgi:hypothetical protein
MKTSIIKKYDSPLFSSPTVNAAIKQTHKELPRNTFGIIDPATKEKYPDLISSHLELRSLYYDEWFIDGYIAESRDRKKNYKLLLDHRTAKELVQLGSIDAMISFQLRNNGAFAVVRLFDSKRVRTRKDI